VQEQQRRSRETAMESNGFWVSALDQAFTSESVEPLDIYRYEDLVSSSSPETIVETANTYLQEDRYYRIILYPENFDADASSSTDSDGASTGDDEQ